MVHGKKKKKEEDKPLLETKNMSMNGLAILGYKEVKHIICIKLTGFSTLAVF